MNSWILLGPVKSNQQRNRDCIFGSILTNATTNKLDSVSDYIRVRSADCTGAAIDVG